MSYFLLLCVSLFASPTFAPAFAMNEVPAQTVVDQAAQAIVGDALLDSIRTLSSDEFEGRSPGTPGEEKTIAFIQKQMKKIGLAPGNPNGTYVQKVPLIGATAEFTAQGFTGDQKIEFTQNKDIVAITQHQVPTVNLKDSEVVFVGYGVVAPEYGWNDYKDVDVKGKTILMLVNDPQIPSTEDSSKLDDSLFKGRAMTYYGRWTYKYEIAQKVGAGAALIIHDTKLAGYPFSVVVDSWGGEYFATKARDKNRTRAMAEGWLTSEKTEEILKANGLDLAALKKAAASKDFKPIVLKTKFSMNIKRTQREAPSHNVVGLIQGSDPKLKHRTLIYSAHWDHFGRSKKDGEDRIFHGALDNASGTAALLETAKAFKALQKAPRSSILFIATTAEERGLLGAKYYAEHPLYPLATTLANINYDGITPWGKTKDLQLVGKGSSDLELKLEALVKAKSRDLNPEADPEKGMYYRTDQFEFSKVGVPAIWYRGGIKYIDKPEGFGEKKRDEFTAHNYHKPSDVIQPDWDMSGAVEDIRLFFALGHQVAEDKAWPQWMPNAEFGHVRDASKKTRSVTP